MGIKKRISYPKSGERVYGKKKWEGLVFTGKDDVKNKGTAIVRL